MCRCSTSCRLRHSKNRRPCSSRRTPCAACAAASQSRPPGPLDRIPLAGWLPIPRSPRSPRKKEKEDTPLEIHDADGKLVKKYLNTEKKKEGPPDPEEGAFGPPRGSEKLPAEAGLNRFVWSLRYEDAPKFDRKST